MKKVIVLAFFIFLLNIELFGRDFVKNAKDKARISQIVAETMKDKNYLTKKIHEEFWSILDAHSSINDEELKRLRLLMYRLFILLLSRYAHFYRPTESL